MIDPADHNESRVLFAAERSHNDSKIANETARTTAQAIILINGGAATAILAFLSKDRIEPHMLQLASWCLVGYAFGVVVGAFMLFCCTRAAEEFDVYWRRVADPELKHTTELKRTPRHAALIGGQWQSRMSSSFFIALLSFFLSSCFLAYLLNAFPFLQ
jgi:hypothetical protein